MATATTPSQISGLPDSNTAVPQEFKYSKLLDRHDIRLLEIAPRTEEGQKRIEGKLIHVSLDERPEYSAISYCWGSPDVASRLWLSDTHFLPLTSSATHILANIRASIYIWIDSVCINQRDDEEKSIQVFMMWGIYKYARRVVVWLGDDTDNAELALQLVFDATNPALTISLTGRKPVWLPMPDPNYNPEHQPPLEYPSPKWTALSKLLNCPWFRRTWVIQEMAAGENIQVICGTEQVTWKDLFRFVEQLKMGDKLDLLKINASDSKWGHFSLPVGIQTVISIEELRSKITQGFRNTMQENLLRTAYAEATDPRDKIFAIGSFSFETGTPALLPDYKATPEDVFIRATSYMLLRDQAILALHLAGVGFYRKLEALPSWVPDYSITPNDFSNGRYRTVLGHDGHLGGGTLYCAASSYMSDVPSKITPGPQIESIKLQGIILDTVKTICEPFPNSDGVWTAITDGSFQQRQEVTKWINKLCRSFRLAFRNSAAYKPNRYTRAGPTRLDALWQTLIAGATHDRRPFDTPSNRALGRVHFDIFLYLLLHISISSSSDGQLDKARPELLEAARPFVRAMDRFSDWTVFETKKGCLGRGPPLLRNGDKICVFQGGRTPFAIRQTRSNIFGPRRYELVGECYVAGLMRKEALDKVRLWGWSSILLV